MYKKTIKDLNAIMVALDNQRKYIDTCHHVDAGNIDRNMCVFLLNFIAQSEEYKSLLRERSRLQAELEETKRKLENL